MSDGFPRSIIDQTAIALWCPPVPTCIIPASLALLQQCDGISGLLSVAKLRVCVSFPTPGEAGVAAADRNGSALEQRRSTRAAQAFNEKSSSERGWLRAQEAKPTCGNLATTYYRTFETVIGFLSKLTLKQHRRTRRGEGSTTQEEKSAPRQRRMGKQHHQKQHRQKGGGETTTLLHVIVTFTLLLLYFTCTLLLLLLTCIWFHFIPFKKKPAAPPAKTEEKQKRSGKSSTNSKEEEGKQHQPFALSLFLCCSLALTFSLCLFVSFKPLSIHSLAFCCKVPRRNRDTHDTSRVMVCVVRQPAPQRKKGTRKPKSTQRRTQVTEESWRSEGSSSRHARRPGHRSEYMFQRSRHMQAGRRHAQHRCDQEVAYTQEPTPDSNMLSGHDFVRHWPALLPLPCRILWVGQRVLFFWTRCH